MRTQLSNRADIGKQSSFRCSGTYEDARATVVATNGLENRLRVLAVILAVISPERGGDG